MRDTDTENNFVEWIKKIVAGEYPTSNCRVVAFDWDEKSNENTLELEATAFDRDGVPWVIRYTIVDEKLVSYNMLKQSDRNKQ